MLKEVIPLVCYFFSHFAKWALAEDFEQFKLRGISFLAALFHVMSDWNLLVCPFILRGNSRCKKTVQIKHMQMCSKACRYLHSERTALPPPLARPWSDAHWPAAKPTTLISGLERSGRPHKTCCSLFLSGGRPWPQQPTQMHRDQNEQVTCAAFPLLVLRGSCICCQTVWTPYSKPVQLSSLHPAPIEPYRYYHSSLIPPRLSKSNMSAQAGKFWRSLRLQSPLRPSSHKLGFQPVLESLIQNSYNLW